MNAETCLTDEQRQAVEEFRKRHRTAVPALLFTDVERSTALARKLGEGGFGEGWPARRRRTRDLR